MAETTARAPAQRWLRPPDIVQRLRKRWDRGEFLTELTQQPWEPLSFGLRSPTAAELANHFGAATDWAETWRRFAGPGVRLEWERVGGRVVGANNLPARIWIENRPALWRLLGVQAEVATFTRLADQTRRECPELSDWVSTHPLKILALEQIWARLIAVVRWIAGTAGPTVYLRQIDAPGVDTKFVEKHQAILAELLDLALPPEKIDPACPRKDFLGRYRLARKPSYVRLRRLDGSPLLGSLAGPAEIGLRVDDLSGSPVDAAVVYIVENDVTYLALPPTPEAIAILGEGYALSRLSSLSWLAERDLVYWGDLDTHGFVMLDQLRATFPRVRSMLMDRQTFLEHEAHWGHEQVPANRVLDRLTPEEASMYQDLVEGRYGERLRLEQERLRFSAVRAALRAPGLQPLDRHIHAHPPDTIAPPR
ncbi:MAG TPA: DUF3322 domain-containing protein [Kineosporiaceae bacterium]|nr:DUF3322 domain-containing protein [Kineosporiaceae bacterium]